MNNKGSVIIFLIIAIIILIIATSGGVFYSLQLTKINPANNSTQTIQTQRESTQSAKILDTQPAPVKAAIPANWKTLTVKSCGITLSYPTRLDISITRKG